MLLQSVELQRNQPHGVARGADNDRYDLDTESNTVMRQDGQNAHSFLTSMLWSITAFCVLSSAVLYIRVGPDWHTQCAVKSNTYSPIEEAQAVRIKNVLFTDRAPGASFGMYEGPLAEVDENWDRLYDFGISQIPESMAKKVLNKTISVPGDPSNYIVQLSVFHELHCLNMLRRHLWTNSTYDVSKERVHLSHCLDNLRQSLMCTIDSTPLPLKYDSIHHVYRPSFDVRRTCRDFDAISAWGKENFVPNFDPHAKPMDMGNMLSKAV